MRAAIGLASLLIAGCATTWENPRYACVAILTFVALSTTPAPSWAGYLAQGEIKGEICRGFVFEVCHISVLDAVDGADGAKHHLTRTYESVTSYDSSKSRCWIQIKSEGLGPISWAFNYFTNPAFYIRSDDGSFEEVDVSYLTFKCSEI